MKTIQLAIFASGSGSNAQKIIQYFEQHQNITVSLVVSNKPDAKVLSIAQAHHIDTLIINRTDFYHSEQILQVFENKKINFIVLAGFLWLIPIYIVKAFPKKIVNIHPALLPKYGGKGMFGHHVHEAVKAANETESGMTIHYVNEHYDEGDIIFQSKCVLSEKDSAEDIAAKVLALEHEHFARVIEQLLSI
jgi:phosphoribosylglycinamide formyltransferase 1